MQPLRRDRDHERAEVADPLAQVGGARVEVAGELGVAALAHDACERGEAQRRAGEVLHHRVVEVGGDAPPLAVGRLDRADEQLALPVARPAQPAFERERERELHEPEQQQPARRAPGRTRRACRLPFAVIVS